MSYPYITELKCCPYCGSTEGYEADIIMKGVICNNFDFNGDYTDQQPEDAYSHLREVGYHKFVRCLDCKKKIARIER